MHAPIRPARGSEWLRCALAQHFSPEPTVRNEVVVLALGVDQYLQEVFHHLAVSAGDGDLVSGGDFRLLCGCLSLDTEEVCSGLPAGLSFRDFHSRLCGVFAARAGKGVVRLPVTEETELVEREIRLRWPRIRRRRCVSFDLNQDRSRSGRYGTRNGLSKEAGLDMQQRALREQVEMENASLRELVEDLRSALQSSDARCMALEVALKRERLSPYHRLGEVTESQSCSSGGETDAGKPKSARRDNRRRTNDLLRELELIRASRDGQLQEAMRFNQRLEEELVVAYREVSRLEEALGSMRRESYEIKRRAEEARDALAAGLKRVRDIQDLAQQVTPLQKKVQNLETVLERFRSQCTCGITCEWRPEATVDFTPRVLPAGRDETFIRGEEGLQRAVEGRAASDEEEEEERVVVEGQCCLLEVKRLINRFHKCSKGCQNTAVCHLLLSQNSTGHYSEPCGYPGPKVRSRRHHMITDEKEVEKDLSLKQEEVDSCRLEVQMVQTERVRLSLLEGKLIDTFSVLLQLREKRVSRRVLAKILLDTLDRCSRKAQDPTPVFQVVDALCEQLVSTELLFGEAEATVGSQPRLTPGHRNTNNPLLISC